MRHEVENVQISVRINGEGTIDVNIDKIVEECSPQELVECLKTLGGLLKPLTKAISQKCKCNANAVKDD